MRSKLMVVAASLLACAGIISADDWPAFRGPAGDGTSSEKSAPTTWGADKNIKWKTPLAQKGNGSPIVSNGRVFIAAQEDAKGLKRSLYCYDRKDGKQLWVQTVEYGKESRTHDTNTYGSSTPTADGKKVVVWHGSAGLHCYDFEGKKLWSRDLGERDHDWGEGTSPVIHGGKIYLNSGPDKKRVFAGAYKLDSGETMWEKEEPFKGNGDKNEEGGVLGSWATPFVLKDQVVFAMPTRLVSYGLDDGKLMWSCEGLRFGNGDVAYSSPMLGGDLIVYNGGYGGPALGVKLGGSGDVTATHRVWRNAKSSSSIGSGVIVGEHAYLPFAQPNVIECMDVKTGKTVWKERQKGPFWGSIVTAGGHAYVTDQKGRTVVFKPSPEKFEGVAVNELGEDSNSTPAISDGQIFIRTFKHLYCIGE